MDSLLSRTSFLALFDSFCKTGDQRVFEPFLASLNDLPKVYALGLNEAFAMMQMSDNALENSEKSIVAAKSLGIITAEDVRSLIIKEYPLLRKNTAEAQYAG